MTTPREPSLSCQQVAVLFSVAESSVYRWVNLGLLPSWIDERGRRRVDAAAVFRLLKP